MVLSCCLPASGSNTSDLSSTWRPAPLRPLVLGWLRDNMSSGGDCPPLPLPSPLLPPWPLTDFMVKPQGQATGDSCCHQAIEFLRKTEKCKKRNLLLLGKHTLMEQRPLQSHQYTVPTGVPRGRWFPNPGEPVEARAPSSPSAFSEETQVEIQRRLFCLHSGAGETV